MNLKRSWLRTIVTGLLVIGMLAITTISNASIAPEPKKLRIENNRQTGYTYQTGFVGNGMAKDGQIMWKIYEYNSNGETIKNINNGFYCLKMGVGFGFDSGSVSDFVDYDIYANMKNPTEADKPIIDNYKTNFLSQPEKYNSIVWILDHAYVPAPSNSPTTEQIENANQFKRTLLQNAEIPLNSILYSNTAMSNDLIDIVQQLAIWSFTNDDVYGQPFTNILYKEVNSTGEYKNLEDIDWYLKDQLESLYNYFIDNAEANKNITPSIEQSNPVKLVADSQRTIIDGDNYIVGPYKIEELINTNYSLEGILYDQNKNNIDYILLDSNKEATTSSLKDLVGNEFYLKISKNANIGNATFKVIANANQNTIKYWMKNANDIQPVAEIIPETIPYELEAKLKGFDLALRKFIGNVNGKDLVDANGNYLTQPVVDITPLVEKTATTALYKASKEPVGVAVGDKVTYVIRVYNEGEIAGYASEVVDHLPAQLKFITDDQTNINYLWQIDENDPSGRTIKTSYLSKDIDDENVINAFDGTTLSYKELKIVCEVVETNNLDKVITNIADVTAATDVNGMAIYDIDSSVNNLALPSDTNLPDYKGKDTNKSILNDPNYFYEGQEDDDDFAKLILEEFDLALRKFITKVNDTNITNRVPVFTRVKDENGNYIYNHTKEPVEVASTDLVEYTLRIYNEGDIAGYAKQIKDNIPEGLEFLPNNSTNIEYRWIMLDENGESTTDPSKVKYIATDYLSKEQSDENLIAAFDSTKTSPDYKDVKVVFKVIASNSYKDIITNIAEISDDSDEIGNPIEDRDSTPNNNVRTEDDIDIENLKLKYFDLALRKFITAVNETEITDRIPVFKITEDNQYVYEHTKEPVEVENGNIVTYTLRIFNEGTLAGYAKEVKDNIPEGLEFLPENDINTEYRWVMLDENGDITDDVLQAVSIRTDYLSKEQAEEASRDNLLNGFDPETMTQPNYKDVKVAFRVVEPNTSDRIIINEAQISNDSDANGNDVADIDSTPDKWIEGEDDQDIEKIKVKYFDLALRKWVTQAIVIDNGKETVTETGHHAEDNPEEVVKVEVKESRVNKVVVKFRYKIRITNEGEIAGYAKEISDYIPEGLKFVPEDNPDWTQVDGKIITTQLKDTLLQPGENAEVEVLLTWINNKDNFGLKVNVAEISKDYNDSNTPDIDSTPNNKVEGEDDIDDAPVILSIKTGTDTNIITITLTATSLAIIATGAILIKKFVL